MFPRHRRALRSLGFTTGLFALALGTGLALTQPAGGLGDAAGAGLAQLGQGLTSLRALAAAALPRGTRSPADEVRLAAEQARAAGSYRFSAEGRQLLTPRPQAMMIGRGEERVSTSFRGAVSLPDQSRIEVTLQGPATKPGATRSVASTLIREGGRSFIEQGGKIEPAASSATLGSPSPDMLGYLAAARDVTRREPLATAGGRVERYRFTLDGPALARHVRDQTERELAGELPGGLRLQPSPALAALAGWGEVWVDEAGLPRRQVLHFFMPAVTAQYDGAGDLTVDFRDYGQVGELPRIVAGVDGRWQAVTAAPSAGRPALARLARAAGGGLGLALWVALAALAVAHRRRRGIYAAVVTVTCLSLVGGPLLQAWGVGAFVARQVAAAGPAPEVLTGAAAARLAPQEPGGPGGAGGPLAGPDQAPPGVPSRSCDSANSGTADFDNDGLVDAFEGCLGTDPANPDTDSDLINDGLEVQGFSFAGRTWTSDPQRIDTNGDGVTDGNEWAAPNGTAPAQDVDGDGLPNVWDEDNDGDGLGDGLDLSAEAVAGYAPTFELTIERPFTDSADDQTYAIVQLQVQPQDAAHLRYGLTPLDWPPDQAGQIQNLGSSPNDVTLVPVLLAKSNLAPALADRYGVSVGQNTDSDQLSYPYELYLPLQPAGSNGAVDGMFAALAFTPKEAQRVLLVTELAWMVQAQLDQWQDCAADTTPSAANCQGYSSQTGTVQVYTEPAFRVAGLQVVKSGPTQVATFGTPQSAANDASLFQLMVGLSATYLVSSSVTLTDVVQTARDPNATPAQHFNITTPVTVAWSGDDPDPADYAYRDVAMATTAQTTTVQFLEENYQTSDNPSLVYAFQQPGGVADLGDLLDGPAGTAALANLAQITTLVERGIKLTMYGYESGAWAALSYQDTMGVAVSREPGLPPGTQFLESYFYAAFTAGQVCVVAVDGVDYATSTRGIEDIAATINTGTWSTVSYWIDQYAGKAGVDDDVFSGTTAAEAMDKIASYTTADVGGSLFILGAFASLVLVLLNLTALADGNQIVTDIVTGVDDLIILIGGLQALAKIYSMVTAGAKGIVAPAVAGQQAIDAVPDDFQVGDDLPDGDAELAIDDATDAAADGMTFGMGLAVVGLIIQVGIVLITTLIVIFNNWGNPQAIGLAVAQAIATLIVVVALFLTTVLVGVGTLIVAVIFLVNLFIEFLTWLFFGQGFNVLGWIIDTIASILYHDKLLTQVNGVSVGPPTTTLKDPAAGVTSGNTLSLYSQVTATLGLTNNGKSADLSNSSAATYWSNALTTAATPLGSPVLLPGSPCVVDANNDTAGCTNPVSSTWQLSETGLGVPLQITTFVNYTLALENITLEVIRSTSTTSGTAPDPSDSDDVQNATSPLALDVLPADLDGFWGWNTLENEDVDADGLSNTQELSTATNPDDWDSDGDQLSDGFEVQGQPDVNQPAPGSNAGLADTDSDGLDDDAELAMGTAVDLADTDGDGLPDGEEVCRYTRAGDDWQYVGGWLAALPNGPSFAAVPVCSNPNDPDEDGDGRNDAQEKAYQTSPFAYNSGLPFLLLTTTPVSRGPQGQAAAYVQPGSTIGLDVLLVNQGDAPVTTTLRVCLPSLLSDLTQTGGPAGAIDAGGAGCDPAQGPSVAWAFSPASSLPIGGELSTTLQAKVAEVGESITATVTGSLPAGPPGKVVAAYATVVVDADDPAVAWSMPADGAALRGASYVVGGSATDPTGWAAQVALSLGQPGVWSPVLTQAARLNPWAATWKLPADGNYTLQAQATDEVGHQSSVAQIEVVVDNTAPTVDLSLAEGALLPKGRPGPNGLIHFGLDGSAADNLSGLEWIELSLDGRAWLPATRNPAAGTPTAATWSYTWTLPAATAQGAHRVAVRTTDRAGNVSSVVSRQVLVDVVPPGLNLVATPSGLPLGRPLLLQGHADETARLPIPAAPLPLAGTLDALSSATVWLGAADGSTPGSAAWLGDVNGDGRDDLGVGTLSPKGSGEVALLYGRAGGWPAPAAQQALAADGSTFVGAARSGVGQHLASAGDFNGDGFDDFLVDDAPNARAFLVYGQPQPYGVGLPLTGPGSTRALITGLGGAADGPWLAPAGDVNSDGFADLLGATGRGPGAYLLLGRSTRAQQLSLPDDAAALLPYPAARAPLQGVGDVNGDLYGDFVLLDPAGSFGPVTGKPTVYLFFGSAAWAQPAPGAAPASVPLSAATAIPIDGSILFRSLAAPGDVDGDGLDDFLYQTDLGVQLMQGRKSDSWHPLRLSRLLGTDYISGVGDVNRDGKADFVVGMSGINEAQLLLGAQPFPAEPPTAATLTNVLTVASAPPVIASDGNCDGSGDLLVIPSPSAFAPQLAAPWTLPVLPSPAATGALPGPAAATRSAGSPARAETAAPAGAPVREAAPAAGRPASAPAQVWVSPAYCASCQNDKHYWNYDAFASIQAAIDTGSPQVMIGAGYYTELLTIDHATALLGSGADRTVILPPPGGLGAAPALVNVTGGQGGQIDGVTLSGQGSGTGLLVSAATDFTLSRAILRELGTGVALSGTATTSLLVNNTIVSNDTGLSASGCAPLNLRNTIFAYHSRAGVAYAAQGCPASSLQYNLFWSNGATTPADVVRDGVAVDAATVGPGQVLADPRFVNLSAADYQLAPGSPAIDAGSPADKPPPGTSLRVDIGFSQQGQALAYADASYCATCDNDGLQWGVDAFATIQDAVDAAVASVGLFGCGAAGGSCAGGLSVVVGPGSYSEAISLPSYIHLVGSGGDLTTLTPAASVPAGYPAGSVVWVDNAVNVLVGGFTIKGFSGTAVNVTGASSAVTVTRNLFIGGSSTPPGGTAFGLAASSRGAAYYNTFANANTAVALNVAGRLVARNNIFAGQGQALALTGSGNGPLPQVLSQRNLFFGNSGNYPTSASSYLSTADLVNVDPLFVNPTAGDFHLQPSSPAVGVAAPGLPASQGGGGRDLGYQGLSAIPATLLFGQPGQTCADANSGVAAVEVGLGFLSRPDQPLTATLPSSWVSAALSGTGQTGSYWSAPVTADAGAGMYRLYGRAADGAGNLATTWLGSYLADGTAPVVTLLKPDERTRLPGAMISLAAEVSDPVTVYGQTVFGARATWFELSGLDGSGKIWKQRVAGRLEDPSPGQGPTTRRFAAIATLVHDSSVEVQAFAQDASGNVGSSARVREVIGNYAVAQVTNPHNGQAVNQAKLPVTGIVNEPNGDTTVDLYVDGQAAGSATVAEPSWTTSSFNGQVTLSGEVSHTLQVLHGRMTLDKAPTTTVRLDLTAPKLTVDRGTNNLVTKDPITFQGSASDDGSGLALVQISTDGDATWVTATLTRTPGGSSPWSVVWRPAGEADGVSYLVRIRATDRAGNSTTATQNVTVDNTPPQAPLASFQYCPPTCVAVRPGATLAGPGTLQLAWRSPVVDGSGTGTVGVLVNQSADPPPTSAFSAFSGPQPFQQAFTSGTAAGVWYLHVGTWDNLKNYRITSYGFSYSPAPAGAQALAAAEPELRGLTRAAPAQPQAGAGSGERRGPPWRRAAAASAPRELAAPSLRFHLPTVLTARSGPHLVTGASSDAGGSGVVRVELRVDGGAWRKAGGTLHWAASVLAPASGSFQVEARAIDADGNVSPIAARTVQVDNSPPTASQRVTSATAGRSMWVEVTAADAFPPAGPIHAVQVQVDNGVWRRATRVERAGGESRWRFAWPVTRGVAAYRFRSRSVDLAGNVGPATASQVVPPLALPAADLGLSQTAPAAVAPGGLLHYVLRVTNQGPDAARNALLVDSLPDNKGLLALPPGCTQQSITLVCQLGDLAPGATRDLAFDARAAISRQDAGLRNVATVRSETWDPGPADNRSAARTALGARLFLPKVEQ